MPVLQDRTVRIHGFSPARFDFEFYTVNLLVVIPNVDSNTYNFSKVIKGNLL